MSVHTSLSMRKSRAHRNVLKRHERIKHLQDKERWTEGRSPLGLPKVKSIQFKVKKSTAEQPDKATAAAGTTGNATSTGAAAAAKPAAKAAAKPVAKPART